MGKTSQYVGVYFVARKTGQKCDIGENMKSPWLASASNRGSSILKKHFATEREAAIAYDKAVLRAGLDRPLNILKPKP